MSARFTLSMPPGKRMTQEEQDEWIKKEEAKFNASSEEDQMLYLQNGKIGAIWNGHPSKEEVAREVLEHEFGPKFADRVLADPASRQKLGLDKKLA